MSSTGRGAKRKANDNYPTPSWCVHRLLDRIGNRLPKGNEWLEPAAGEGAITRAVDIHRRQHGQPALRWAAVELREECRAALASAPGGPGVYIADFLEWKAACNLKSWSVAITNPPYSLAREFVDATLPLAYATAMLLRLNFLGSEMRAPWWQNKMPSLYILPNRPSFTSAGTDSCEYAWFVWGLDAVPTVQILGVTPKQERTGLHETGG